MTIVQQTWPLRVTFIFIIHIDRKQSSTLARGTRTENHSSPGLIARDTATRAKLLRGFFTDVRNNDKTFKEICQRFMKKKKGKKDIIYPYISLRVHISTVYGINIFSKLMQSTRTIGFRFCCHRYKKSFGKRTSGKRQSSFNFWSKVSQIFLKNVQRQTKNNRFTMG